MTLIKYRIEYDDNIGLPGALHTERRSYQLALHRGLEPLLVILQETKARVRERELRIMEKIEKWLYSLVLH